MKFGTLILFLVSLWGEDIVSGHHNIILRVKPSETLEDITCQHNESDPEQCEILDYYVTQRMTLLTEANVINLTFLQGRHYPVNFVTETVEIRDKKSLVLQGSGEDTSLVDYKFRLLSIKNILISGMKCVGLKIDLDTPDNRPHLKLSNVTIRNCTFIDSALIFKAILLHVENSRFTDSSQNTALKLYSSYVTFHGSVSFLNNNAISGGALSLIESVIYVKGICSVDFTNNSAEEVGGAVFIDNNDECFYVAESGHSRSSCKLHFHNNKAKNGGDHIYGTSFMSDCPNHPHKFPSESQQTTLGANWSSLFVFEQPSFNNGDSLSVVSSTPSRVCLCNDEGQPACTDIDKIFVKIKSCLGEVIEIPVVLVGADFGTTIGNIHASVIHENSSQTDHDIHTRVDVYPIKQNKKCTILKYKTVSSNSYQLVYLSTTSTDTRHISSNSDNIYKIELQREIVYYETHGMVQDLLQYTPIFVNISLSECPPGFTMYTHNGVGCDCYEPLKRSISNLKCTVEDHRGYMSWNTTAWIGFDESKNLIYSKHCFPYYCRRAYKKIDMGNETLLNTQCWPNRQGILCSKCTEGHSLAIGSSNCILCPNDNNLALLIFFAISGFLLVLFINLLNLTVTQGMINGLIFYANVVWEHQSIASQREIKYTRVFLKPFIAWLNLDFGIETCFVKGLDPYTKTWLQFLFPLYIWMIAGLMITAAHYSTKVTNLIGNRALHTLCTLFFLSYSKLFRIIKDILHLTVLATVYENGTVHKQKIWLWEGDKSLLDSKYLGLFIFATFIFLVLWIPYTVILTCIQPLRRVSHYKCCNWINKLSPIFDSYLAPLKHRHHYFFGVLLLTRGLLLMIVLVPSRGLNLHNLMIIAVLTLILIHMAVNQPYRSKAVLIFQCISFGNLIILVGVISYLKIEDKRYKYWVLATTISVTVAFIQFCVIVMWSAVRVYRHNFRCTCACKAHQHQNSDEDESEAVFGSSIESRRERFNTSYLQEPTILGY